MLSRVSNPAAIATVFLGDMLLLIGCYFGAFFWSLRNTEPWFYFRYDDGWLQIAIEVLVIQAGFFFLGLYEDLRSFSKTQFLQRFVAVLGLSFLIQALLGYGSWEALQLPQWTIVYGSALLCVALPLWRVLFLSLVRDTLPSRKLLLLGASPEMDVIAEALRSDPHLGYTVVRHLPSFAQYEREGFVSDIEEIVVSQGMERQLPVEALLDARLYGVHISSAGALYETLFGRVASSSLRPSRWLLAELPRPRSWALALQGGFSTLLAVIVVLLTAVPQLLLGLLIKATSPGPILERGSAVGLGGKPFTIYKFRTEDENGLTPVGRWLQHFHLDLLPRFWNLARGDMALVGPTPQHPEFSRTLDSCLLFHHLRHTVRPGLVSWARAHRRPGEPMDAMVELEYDLHYVKHLDPALDLYILLNSMRERVPLDDLTPQSADGLS